MRAAPMLLVAVAASACGHSGARDGGPAGTAQAACSTYVPQEVLEADSGPAPNDPAWHAALQKIAKGYPSWGRVDELARVAPADCKAPPPPPPARYSGAEGSSEHGRKLYYLYARDAVAYGAKRALAATRAKPADGLDDFEQVVVKEAFGASPSDAQGKRKDGELPGGPDGARAIPALHGGAHFVPGGRGGLFVMLRPRARPAETAADDGWVYATIEPDMQTVTSAGRVANCMRCHQRAPKGRLFGLPEDPAAPAPSATAAGAR